MTPTIDLYYKNSSDSDYTLLLEDAKVGFAPRFTQGRIIHRLDVLIPSIEFARDLVKMYRQGIKPGFKLVIKNDGEEDVERYIGCKGTKLINIEANTATFESENDEDELYP